MRELRSYIVRIYRQGAHTLAGVVEDPRSGVSQPFQTAEQLWDLVRKQGVAGSGTRRSNDASTSEG